MIDAVKEDSEVRATFESIELIIGEPWDTTKLNTATKVKKTNAARACLRNFLRSLSLSIFVACILFFILMFLLISFA
jgi:hypothetical protein